jgi:hypothetical protein
MSFKLLGKEAQERYDRDIQARLDRHRKKHAPDTTPKRPPQPTIVIGQKPRLVWVNPNRQAAQECENGS